MIAHWSADIHEVTWMGEDESRLQPLTRFDRQQRRRSGKVRLVLWAHVFRFEQQDNL